MGGAVTSCRGDSTSSVGEKSTEELIPCSGGDGVRLSVVGENRAVAVTLRGKGGGFDSSSPRKSWDREASRGER